MPTAATGRWCFAMLFLLIGTELSIAEESRETRLIRAVTEADGPDWEAYQELFVAAPKVKLVELKAHSHDGVALRAAWELMHRTSREAARGSSETVKINKRSVERFLGFVEGRLNVPIPEGFERTILSAEISLDWVDFGDVLLSPFESWPYERTQLGPVATTGLGAAKVYNDVILSTADDAYRIPARFAASAVQPADAYGLVFAIDDERCIAAFFVDTCRSYRIHCIDRQSTDVRWSAEVWAAQFGGSTGLGHHVASMVLRDEIVYLFGGCAGSLYIEAFNVSDGSNRFRFATAY